VLKCYVIHCSEHRKLWKIKVSVNVGECKKVYGPVWKCPLRINKLNCVTLKYVEFMHLRLVI